MESPSYLIAIPFPKAVTPVLAASEGENICSSHNGGLTHVTVNRPTEAKLKPMDFQISCYLAFVRFRSCAQVSFDSKAYCKLHLNP